MKSLYLCRVMQEKSIRHYPFWVYVLLFLASQLTAMVMPLALGVLTTGHVWSEALVLATTLLVANVLAIGLFFCFRPAQLTLSSTLEGLRGKNALRTMLVVLLAVPAILFVNLAQELLLPEIPDLVGEEMFETIMYHPLGLLTIAFLGPVSEELLFRGGVQTALAKKGLRFSIFVSAIIFSFIHLNPAQMPAAFLLGLLLGYAYGWTGSLVAPVCIHVLNNGSACLLAFLSPEDDSFVSFIGGNDAAWMAMGISVLFFVFLVWKMHQIR